MRVGVEVAIIIVVTVWQLVLVKIVIAGSLELPAERIAKPGCKHKCGNATIPYPFGIGKNCYHQPWFEVECDEGNDTFTLKKVAEHNLNHLGQRQQISWKKRQPTVTVKISPIFFTAEEDGSFFVPDSWALNLEGSPFLFSEKHNILFVSGCGGATTLLDRRNQIIAPFPSFKLLWGRLLRGYTSPFLPLLQTEFFNSRWWRSC